MEKVYVCVVSRMLCPSMAHRRAAVMMPDGSGEEQKLSTVSTLLLLFPPSVDTQESEWDGECNFIYVGMIHINRNEKDEDLSTRHSTRVSSTVTRSSFPYSPPLTDDETLTVFQSFPLCELLPIRVEHRFPEGARRSLQHGTVVLPVLSVNWIQRKGKKNRKYYSQAPNFQENDSNTTNAVELRVGKKAKTALASAAIAVMRVRSLQFERTRAMCVCERWKHHNNKIQENTLISWK